MTNITFRDLPLPTRIATLLTYFWSWVLIEELVIDRHGLDRYLPLYRVGQLCTYDLVAVVVLVWLWFRWNSHAR